GWSGRLRTRPWPPPRPHDRCGQRKGDRVRQRGNRAPAARDRGAPRLRDRGPQPGAVRASQAPLTQELNPEAGSHRPGCGHKKSPGAILTSRQRWLEGRHRECRAQKNREEGLLSTSRLPRYLTGHPAGASCSLGPCVSKVTTRWRPAISPEPPSPRGLRYAISRWRLPHIDELIVTKPLRSVYRKIS